jgi:hypothetical protein
VTHPPPPSLPAYWRIAITAKGLWFRATVPHGTSRRRATGSCPPTCSPPLPPGPGRTLLPGGLSTPTGPVSSGYASYSGLRAVYTSRDCVSLCRGRPCRFVVSFICDPSADSTNTVVEVRLRCALGWGGGGYRSTHHAPNTPWALFAAVKAVDDVPPPPPLARAVWRGRQRVLLPAA